MNIWWMVVPVLLVAAVAAVVRRGRAQRLQRIRTSWGHPVERLRRIDLMAATHASRIAGATDRYSLHDRTWLDLNLDEVFATLDRTHSTLGQHALYHRLRTAPVADHLEAFEALVQRMSDDPAARERAQLALSRLQDPHGYDVWWLARTDAVERHAWYVAFPVLTAGAIVLAAVAPFWPGAVMALVAVLPINGVIRYAVGHQIGTIARSFRQCAPLIATAESLRFLAGEDIDPIVGPLHVDVPILARLKLISRWVNGDPFMLSVNPHPLAVAASDLVAAVYEYLNLGFLLDATGVYFGARDLSRHGAALVRAVAAAGEVDAAISIASYRALRRDWTRPEFRAADATTRLTELRHPLIEDAVANSIVVQPGRGVLVTGSNMSGKSTFLRTVGVNVVLAQTIDTCLARQHQAPIFQLRSCIGRADDLLTGKSYYIAEVEALLELVRASEDSAPHLFLLDELFRGTNAVERIASGQAVLLQLLGPGETPPPHIVLAATHDQELVDLASSRFDAYHFGDSIGPDGLIFNHRLQHGPATTRNAIALLRLYGAPETLLTQAVTTAEMLDRQRGRTLVAR
jgi:MutS domain V